MENQQPSSEQQKQADQQNKPAEIQAQNQTGDNTKPNEQEIIQTPKLDDQQQKAEQENKDQQQTINEPIKVIRPPTPDDIDLKPDTQTLQILSLIINRLRIMERNIAVYNDDLREEHIQREIKLARINQEINQLYDEYAMFMVKEDDLQELEKRIKVEIDYNLIRILENKLKMDKEVYIMRKKLYERTVRMRELQVKVYNLKQEKKDHLLQLKDQENKIEEREKEIRRLQDIVYDVTTLNIKPNFAMGSNKLSVPKYKNYDQYMINQQKDLQQQKYYLDNQTLKFGRKQGEVLKDGIWQTQLMGGSKSNKNLLQNTGQQVLGASGGRGFLQGMSLSDLLPDSWINNKYLSTVEKPRLEDTVNDRESYGEGGSSYKSNSYKSKDLSPRSSDIVRNNQVNRNYY